MRQSFSKLATDPMCSAITQRTIHIQPSLDRNMFRSRCDGAEERSSSAASADIAKRTSASSAVFVLDECHATTPSSPANTALLPAHHGALESGGGAQSPLQARSPARRHRPALRPALLEADAHGQAYRLLAALLAVRLEHRPRHARRVATGFETAGTLRHWSVPDAWGGVYDQRHVG